MEDYYKQWITVHDDAVLAGLDRPEAVERADAEVPRPSPPPTPPSLTSQTSVAAPEKPSTVAVALPRRVTPEGAKLLAERGERVERAPYGSVIDPLYVHYEVVHLTQSDLRRAADLKMRGELHEVGLRAVS